MTTKYSKLNFRPSLLSLAVSTMGLTSAFTVQSAGIVVDPNAKAQHQATVVQEGDLPVTLNIAAPNAAGVSHNKFSEFNVDHKGLDIINEAGQSGLGNPNFSDRTASIIINEVIGSNGSTLTGATAIIGDRAEYILANPNGIHCDGCSFENIEQVTLTTGTPELDTEGKITGLQLNDGQITIGEKGLEARDAEYLNFITSNYQAQGAVKAQDVNIRIGRGQRYDIASDAIEGKPSTPTPGSMDAITLGAMQANRIHIKTSEAGVGVSMPDAQDLIRGLDLNIQAAFLKNQGKIQGRKTAKMQANQLHIENNIVVKGDVDLEVTFHATGLEKIKSSTGKVRLNGRVINETRSPETSGQASVSEYVGISVDPSQDTKNISISIPQGNNAPKLNISKPNDAGISHNKFLTFNVGVPGLEINNVSKGAPIFVNPNLKAGSAKMIINEVTGNHKSLLKGKTKILGDKAEYILANPNGIDCDGCGFENTQGVTLTAGTASFDDFDDTLLGIDLQKGHINIKNNGIALDKNVRYLNLVGRSLKLDGAIDAQNPEKMKVILATGDQHRFHVKKGFLTPNSDLEKTEKRVGTSIEVSSAATIDADQIIVQSVDDEAWVRLAAHWIADKSLKVLINGYLAIVQSAKLESGKIGLQSADDMTISGTVNARNKVSISDYDLEDLMVGNVDTNSGGGVIDIKTPKLKITKTGRVTSDGNLNAQGSPKKTTMALKQQGLIKVGGDADFYSHEYTSTADALLSITGDAKLTGNIDSQGTVKVGGQLTTEGLETYHDNLTLAYLEARSLKSDTGERYKNIALSNMTLKQSLDLKAQQRIDLASSSMAEHDISLAADQILLTGTHEAKRLAVTAKDKLSVRQANITVQDFSFEGQQLSLSENAILSTQKADLEAKQQITVSSDATLEANHIDLDTPSLIGQLKAKVIATGIKALSYLSGLKAEENIVLRTNQNTHLPSGAYQIKGLELIATQGSIDIYNNANLQLSNTFKITKVANASGAINFINHGQLKANEIDVQGINVIRNHGSLNANTIVLKSSAGIHNTQGIKGTSTLTLKAPSVGNIGTLQGGTVTIEANRIANRRNGVPEQVSYTHVVHPGTTQWSISSKEYDCNGTEMSQCRVLKVSGSGKKTDREYQLISPNFDGTAWASPAPKILSSNRMELKVAHTNNNGGAIISHGDLHVQGGNIHNQHVHEQQRTVDYDYRYSNDDRSGTHLNRTIAKPDYVQRVTAHYPPIRVVPHPWHGHRSVIKSEIHWGGQLTGNLSAQVIQSGGHRQ